MEKWAGLKALVFDLDGTLYDSPRLLAQYPRLAVEFIAGRLGLSRAEAEARFAEEGQWIVRATGHAPSTTRILLTLTGATLEEWATYVAARIDPAAYLDPRDYAWLRQLLRQLRRYYRLGIVSNNNRVLAERILGVLGIRHCFDAMLTINESRRIKPDPSLYRDIAGLLGVEPAACLSIGDRLRIDIIPAEQAGMRGALVKDLHQLRALGEELLAAARQRQVVARVSAR